MRIRDWGSDVCSSDLEHQRQAGQGGQDGAGEADDHHQCGEYVPQGLQVHRISFAGTGALECGLAASGDALRVIAFSQMPGRSEEHTSELQSLMRISYAVFCLKKKKSELITINTLTRMEIQ